MATTSSRPPVSSPAPPRKGRTARSGAGGTQRVLDFLKRWAVPIIGGITPVALIAINTAVWINDHVHDLAIWVAIAAFVSGMMFNSWIGLNIYRWVQRRWPDWSPVTEQNQEVVLVLGMGAITLITFLTSLFLYFGLRDAKGLPNAWTLWYGIIQIAYPFALKIYVDRDRRRRGGTWEAPADATPAAITGPPAQHEVIPPAGRGGYGGRPPSPIGPSPQRPAPPPDSGYLPPS